MPIPEQPTMTFDVRCWKCHRICSITVSKKDWERYKNREGLIGQDLFLNLSSGQRELLISRTCEPCFDAMFKDYLDDVTEGEDDVD